MQANFGDFGGYHYFPDDPAPVPGYYNAGFNYFSQVNSLKPSGYGFQILMHEIGHGLGLAHPHDNGMGTLLLPGVTGPNDLGTLSYNQNINTIMSYNQGPVQSSGSNNFGHAATLMAFDIAAVQFLYGANTTYHTGNDTYVLPGANAAGTFWQCIWDAGGSDAIRYDGASNATIDLRAATLVNGDPNAGGFLSQVAGAFGGFTIAHGVTIENAFGGSGNDIIVGNSQRNFLVGGPGNDNIQGGNANDTMTGDEGNDTLAGGNNDDSLIGGIGTDSLDGGAGNDTIDGGDGNDTLIGGTNDDSLIGGIGADSLDGGSGNDTMIGGADNDTYIVNAAGDVVTELAGGGTDTVQSSVTYTLGSDVENLTLTGAATINATGNSLANVITGSGGNNVILGLDGNDTIDGGAGNNTVTGGLGADSINVNNGNDRLLYNSTLEVGDIVTNFDNAGGSGNQDYIDLDGLFDSLGVAAAARAGRTSLVDTGANVDLRVDTDGNGSFETTVLTFSGMTDTTGMTIGTAATSDIQVGT